MLGIKSLLYMFVFGLSTRKIGSQDLSEEFSPLTNFQFLSNGLYRGDQKDGLPHGNGEMLYFTDDVDGRYNYTGLWHSAKPHGQGITIFRNGDVHSGNYQNGLLQGRGEVRFSNGNVFEGFFDKGSPRGSGSIKYEDGTRRDGEWKDGKLHGFAFFHFEGPDSPVVERWNNGEKVSGQMSQEQTPQPPPPPLFNVKIMVDRKASGFPLPGDHSRSQSAKSFHFSKQHLSHKDKENQSTPSQDEDWQRRKILYEFVHSKGKLE